MPTYNFLPLTIRLETLGGVATPLVLRGTPLPAKRSETFSTSADNQSAVVAKILLGESSLTRNNVEIGVFRLDDIPPAKQGEPKIVIEFLVDRDCTITASASLNRSKLPKTEVFSPPKELSDVFVRKTLAEAEKSRAADESALHEIEIKNRAVARLRQAEQVLENNPSDVLKKAVAALGLALEADDKAAIEDRSDALGEVLSSSSLFADFDFSNIFQVQKTRERIVAPQKKSTSSATHENELKASPPKHLLGKIFGGGQFTLDPQLCFVLMPFSARFRDLYEDNIRPAIERVGLRCERADEIRGTTLITVDIWERINRARFLLAELTDQNPNVFYELGLAHALGKDVILVTQSMDFVPFDLKALRCIVYEFTPRGTKKFQQDLESTVDMLMKSG